MSIPNTITAGTTIELPITLTAYPAPDWQAILIMRGPTQIDLQSHPRNNQHVLSASAATTSTWTPGKYWYALRVTNGTQIEQVEDGELTIAPDLSQTAAAYDGRDHLERVLDAIEAVIEGRASKDQQMYKINHRELQRTPIGDLLLLRNTYRNELARKRRAARGSSLLGRQIKVRF